MVLWEVTLGTAYFLGLKRTYKLALRIQRRLLGPKHPKIRQFLHRKTRAIFDVALKVHREVQQRDIEVGRNLGNWILRWLDKMKPAAQIRSHPHSHSHPNSHSHSHSHSHSVSKSSNSNNDKNPHKTTTKSYSTNSFHHKPPPQSHETRNNNHLFSSRKSWHSPYPTIAIMMRPPVGINTHYRRFHFNGVIRDDIMQWMMHN